MTQLTLDPIFETTALLESFPVTELVLPGSLRAKIDTSDLATILSVSTRWRASWCRYSQTHYVKAANDQLLHRVVTAAPAGSTVDHQDHNGLNNRRSNLRVVSQAINSLNRRQARAKSGYRGVVLRPNGLWRASVMIRGKRVLLGDYAEVRDAGKAVQDFIAEVSK